MILGIAWYDLQLFIVCALVIVYAWWRAATAGSRGSKADKDTARGRHL